MKDLIAGAAGYMGAVWVPKSFAAGHEVRLIALHFHGDAAPEVVGGHLTQPVPSLRT
jgi:hypothetical protein